MWSVSEHESCVGMRILRVRPVMGSTPSMQSWWASPPSALLSSSLGLRPALGSVEMKSGAMLTSVAFRKCSPSR